MIGKRIASPFKQTNTHAKTITYTQTHTRAPKQSHWMMVHQTTRMHEQTLYHQHLKTKQNVTLHLYSSVCFISFVCDCNANTHIAEEQEWKRYVYMNKYAALEYQSNLICETKRWEEEKRQKYRQNGFCIYIIELQTTNGPDSNIRAIA